MRIAQWSLAATLLVLTACQSSPADQAREHEAAMIAQAKADAEKESAYVQDSAKLAQTFTVDTVARPFTMNQRMSWEDDNGDQKDTTLALHIIQGRRGGFCNNMDVKLWSKRAPGDTLTCQWSRRAEGVSEEDSQ